MGKQTEYTKFLRNKAKPLMDKLPAANEFYNDLWYQLVTKHPGLCCKIEELRCDVPSWEEFGALKRQVEEQGVIIQELWKHRVRGVAKK